MFIELDLILTLCALLLEALIGYPPPLLAAIRHPVIWAGTLLMALERRLNAESMPDRLRRLNGAMAVGLLLLASVIGPLAIQIAALRLLPVWLALSLLAIIASTLIAQRSLYEHVAAVADALELNDLQQARLAVSRIVSRDPTVLDEAGIARAAIESLAENFSDGVVAPALYCTLFGLPGIAAYKAINTADSMIGHRNARFEAFGFAAAKLDDLVNLPASRLAALWLVLAAYLRGHARGALAIGVVSRDARRHRSPNAGWPEAAIAGALGLKLAGPRVYGGEAVDEPWIGDGNPHATAVDVHAALELYRDACAIQIAAYVALALLSAPV